MGFAFRVMDDAVTLSLAGRLDGDAAESLRPEVERLVEDAPRSVVVDLAQVGFMDGAGLGAVAFLAKRLGRRLEVTGANGQPLALLRHLGLDRTFGLPAVPRPSRPSRRPLAGFAWGSSPA